MMSTLSELLSNCFKMHKAEGMRKPLRLYRTHLRINLGIAKKAALHGLFPGLYPESEQRSSLIFRLEEAQTRIESLQKEARDFDFLHHLAAKERDEARGKARDLQSLIHQAWQCLAVDALSWATKLNQHPADLNPAALLDAAQAARDIIKRKVSAA